MEVTLFEIHLDGAQFGPATIGDEVMDRMTRGRMARGEGTTAGESSEDESGGKSRSFVRRAFRFVPVVVVFGIAGYAASRRFRGGEEMMDVDAEAVEIEA